MRTKFLIASAACAVLSSVAAFAQVYSVNAVGFINVTIPASGFGLIANQLNASPNNAVTNIFPSVPDGTTVYTFSATTASYSVNVKDFGVWTRPGDTLSPGQGAFVRNPTATPLVVTFVGEVPQGTLTTPLSAGLQIVSSQVPQAGQLDGAAGLGFPVVDGDTVYRWNPATQNYIVSAYDFGAWVGAAPAPGVGDAFFVNKAPNPTAWTRTFSVNQ